MTKEKLLEILKRHADDAGDPEGSHKNAEDDLLAFIDDLEITKAWKEASENWWYA